MVHLAVDDSIFVVPESSEALAEVCLAGDGIPVGGLELPHCRRHAVIALLRSLVAHALRHRMHVLGSTDPIITEAVACQAGERNIADLNQVGYDAAARGGGAAFLIDNRGVELADEGIVAVAEEATGKLWRH